MRTAPARAGRLARGLLATLLWATLSPVVSVHADEPAPLVVAIGGPAEDPAYLPVHAAAALGTFDAEGVRVTLRRAKHPTGAVELLRAREAAIAVTTLDQAVRGAWARDVPVRVLVAHTRAPAAVLFVSPAASGKVARVQDLRGQKVGIPGPGTTGHLVLLRLLQEARLAPWQVDIQSVGGLTQLTRLGSGDLAAAILDEPWASRALAARAATPLLDLRQPEVSDRVLGGPFYEVVSVTPSGAQDTKPDTKKGAKPEPKTDSAGAAPRPPPEPALRAFVRGVVRVQAWLSATPPGEVAERLPASLVGDRERFLARLAAARPAYVPDGEATAAGLQSTLAVLRGGTPWPISLHVEPKDLREPPAVTAARSSLGPTPPAP
jgi:NitT/TauT family transport system substrate-binding protein